MHLGGGFDSADPFNSTMRLAPWLRGQPFLFSLGWRKKSQLKRIDKLVFRAWYMALSIETEDRWQDINSFCNPIDGLSSRRKRHETHLTGKA